jgi:methionyl-tRNA synthetase
MTALSAARMQAQGRCANRQRDSHGRLMPMQRKNCDSCGREYKPANRHQRFCSRECAGTIRRAEPCGVTYLSDYDWAAVERLLNGAPVRSTPADRYRAAVKLFGYGLSNAMVARRIGCTQRTAERYRARWNAAREQVAA